MKSANELARDYWTRPEGRKNFIPFIREVQRDALLVQTAPSDLKVGDKVVKSGGDYSFEGTIVAKFAKLSGVERIVVENEDGILHIFNTNQVVNDTQK